jgi:hypothetical protein
MMRRFRSLLLLAVSLDVLAAHARTLEAQAGGRRGAAGKPPIPKSLAPAATPVVSDEPEPAMPQVAMLAGVIEDSIGAPILDAEIAILGTSLHTRSGTGGTWRIPGVVPGPVLVSARRVGYHPQTLTVHVREGETHALDLTLNEVMARPFVLPERVIFATPKSFRSVFHEGFYQRKLSYPGGTYFTREDILMFKPTVTSDMFRTVPGFYQSRDRRGQIQWVVRGVSGSQACPIRFFVDGINVPLMGLSIDEIVQPSDIEGIEIYKGLSTVPAEFSGRSLQDDSRCGVVAIWTRVTR